ncbi:MAG: helix-turn-helix domain-containing protein [Alphaproteobacteria bacterium]|nr:helix-turn-helix domain-containing protein [Alphaproteobacteria bacterium]
MADPVLFGVLEEIREVAGLAAALQLAAAKGGGPVYFCSAAHLTQDHWLVQTVGWEAARKLAAHFGGRANPQIKIPYGPTSSRGKTWQGIQKGFAQGLSLVEIARRNGVDEKTVRRHRRGQSGPRRSRDDHGQGNLF